MLLDDTNQIWMHILDCKCTWMLSFPPKLLQKRSCHMYIKDLCCTVLEVGRMGHLQLPWNMLCGLISVLLLLLSPASPSWPWHLHLLESANE